MEATSQGNVGEGIVSSIPRDEIKEESMPQLDEYDVQQTAGPVNEASTSDLVVTKII